MKQRIHKIMLFLLCAATLCCMFPCTAAFAASNPERVTRLAGNHRVTTSFLIADQIKDIQGIEQFDSVIIASGAIFADALPGSYLAAVKQDPHFAHNGIQSLSEPDKGLPENRFETRWNNLYFGWHQRHTRFL